MKPLCVLLYTEMEPFYLLHFTYGMDYTRKGAFTPGKYGEWRFDKRTYAQLPPPRHLSEPPRGMKNALVGCCFLWSSMILVCSLLNMSVRTVCVCFGHGRWLLHQWLWLVGGLVLPDQADLSQF